MIINGSFENELGRPIERVLDFFAVEHINKVRIVMDDDLLQWMSILWNKSILYRLFMTATFNLFD